MHSFQNCLDYFHTHNLNQLLNRTLPLQKTARRGKIDPERSTYSLLLNHTLSQLHKIRTQAQVSKVAVSPSVIDRQLICPVSQQIVELAQRQCNQRSTLFKIIFNFYRQSLQLMDLSCQDAIKKCLLEYSKNLNSQTRQSQSQMNLLKSELSSIRQQNQEKWKTFYMIVKDNRVLRRQKGKLMRILQEEKQKLVNVHEEMMEVAKENQKIKLLTNYHQGEDSLTSFLKNTQAILKLEHFMKKYPKETKRLLKADLKKLEISENASLDEKVMYIIKAAKESQEIFDEYEDLVDTNDKPNKFIFNISTQTDSFDTGIEPQPVKIQEPKKHFYSSHCQTYQHLELQSFNIEVNELISKPYESKITKRRRGLKTNVVEDVQLIDAVRHFKENGMQRVVNLKIVSRAPTTKTLQYSSNLYNLLVYDEPQYPDFPQLSINHKLQRDIKRSKDIVRKEQEKRSSRHSSLTNRSVTQPSQPKEELSKQKIIYMVESKIEPIRIVQDHVAKISNFQRNLQPIVQESKHEEKKPTQKYIINPPQNKRNSKKTEPGEAQIENNTTFNKTLKDDFTNQTTRLPLSRQRLSQRPHKTSLNELARRSVNHYTFNQNSKIFQDEEKQVMKPKLELSQEVQRKEIRKSAFASFKKINTMTNEVITKLPIEEVKPNVVVQTCQKQTQTDTQPKIQPILQVLPTQRQSSLKANTQKNSIFKWPYDKPQTSRTKNINIFSSDCSKLMDKILKQVYLKRKEISEGNYNFQSFLHSFITTQYGSSQKIVISNHMFGLKSQKNSMFLLVADALLDKSQPQEYQLHLFKLFARLLILNNSDGLVAERFKAAVIEHEMLSIHFSQEKCKAIAAKHDLGVVQQAVNVCQIFLNLNRVLCHSLQSSQVFLFLEKLFPSSQKLLAFQQVKQIFELFIFQNDYYTHLITLKKYCNPHISVQNLCFYALREEWSPLLHIEDYIFDRSTAIEPFIPEKWKEIARHSWTSELIKEKEKDCNSSTLILRKYLRLLDINALMIKHMPVSQHLTEINKQTSILKLKNPKFDTFF